MTNRIVTPPALENIERITRNIAQNNREAALRYYNLALDTFENWPDNHMPRRAHPRLPEYVRAANLEGFKGYTLHIADLDGGLYLVGAFAPGLPDGVIIRRTHQGLKEI